MCVVGMPMKYRSSLGPERYRGDAHSYPDFPSDPRKRPSRPRPDHHHIHLTVALLQYFLRGGIVVS